MEGATILKVEQRRGDLRRPFPRGFARRLTGRRVVSVGRRAKYLVIDLDDGMALVAHLGMSGSFRIENEKGARATADPYHPRSKAAAHDHVVFHMSGAKRAQRACGSSSTTRAASASWTSCRAPISKRSRHFKAIGIEPLGNALDGAYLARAFSKKKAPLKAALMDQRLVAGLGNIYVCEALWAARLSPDRKAGTLATRAGKPDARRRPAGRGDPRGARSRDQGRRVVAPRPHPGKRRTRRFPARLQCL